MSRGTPVALLIFVRPVVEINPVERHAVVPDGNRDEMRPYRLIEAILVHAQIGGRVSQSDEARHDFHPDLSVVRLSIQACYHLLESFGPPRRVLGPGFVAYGGNS